MVIDIHSGMFSKVLDTLAEKLGTRKHALSGGSIITLPAELGRGMVHAMSFPYGLSLLIWHLQLKEDLTVYLEPSDQHPLRLMCCKQGLLTHSLDAQHVQYQLMELGASISGCSGSIDQVFHWSCRQPVALYMVEVDQQLYRDRLQARDEQDQQIQRIFTRASPFLYQTHYGHSVSEVLREITEAEYFQNIIRYTFLEAKTLELLSLLMQQYIDDQQPLEVKQSLSESDIEKLVLARRYIIEHYADSPSIPELARIVGLNDFKLKKGYKQLFRATIYEHVRQERLDQARKLVAEGKWDIGEIVRRVGYTNKSHFSARFEERYGIKPKEYQKRASQSKRAAVDDWSI